MLIAIEDRDFPCSNVTPSRSASQLRKEAKPKDTSHLISNSLFFLLRLVVKVSLKDMSADTVWIDIVRHESPVCLGEIYASTVDTTTFLHHCPDF